MKNNNKAQELQELLDVLKTLSTSINKNHTDLVTSKAMHIKNISVVYGHGEIDQLGEDALDFINLYNIKNITEYLIEKYDNTITEWVEKPGGAMRNGYERKQSILK